jgi:hypothetical protein
VSSVFASKPVMARSLPQASPVPQPADRRVLDQYGLRRELDVVGPRCVVAIVHASQFPQVAVRHPSKPTTFQPD